MYLRHRPAGRNKIQDEWGATVYQVVDVLGTTYTVQPAEGGPVKRVNRVDIRPCVKPPIQTPRNVTEPICEPEVVMETQSESGNSDGEAEEGVIVEEVSFAVNPNLDTGNCPVRDCECESAESESGLREVEVPVLSQEESESVEPESRSDQTSCVQAPVPTVQPKQKLSSVSRVQPPTPAPRRSKRVNAGTHPNPHHEPKSVLETLSLSPAMVSHIVASLGTVFFREALNEVKNSY